MIDPEKTLLGVAAVISATGAAIAAWKSTKTYNVQKETTESTKTSQNTIVNGNEDIIRKVDDLAVEVRSNRVEVQNAKKKNDDDLLLLNNLHAGVNTRLNLIEAAIQTVIRDILEIKSRATFKSHPPRKN